MLQNNFGGKKCEVFWFDFLFCFTDCIIMIMMLSRTLRIIQFNWGNYILVMAFNFWVQSTNYLAIVSVLQVKYKLLTNGYWCGRISMRTTDTALYELWYIIQYNTTQYNNNTMHWIHFNGFLPMGPWIRFFSSSNYCCSSVMQHL